MKMRNSTSLISVLLSLLLLVWRTHQLRSYQVQALLQLRKHLEYPSPLNVWETHTGDLCSSSSPPHMSIKCENDTVTEISITGDKNIAKVMNEFRGYAIPNQTLSPIFSIDSFATTLARLSSLRVVSLVSLGIWGPLPEKIHRLYSLEALDMSSNYIFGSIPPEMSRMVKLRSLTFDGNYLNNTIPEWLDSLSNLTVLSLKNNKLKSEVPSSVSRITTLTELALSNNLLSGELPDLSALSNLQLLDLRNNSFRSELPPLPNVLANIFLSNNSFSGRIPEQFGKMNELQHLDLSGNHLIGIPPVQLFSLPNISYLNLSSNTLGGSLPGSLTCGDALSLVDVSNNRFTGELPGCLNTNGENRVVRVSGNCFSKDAENQHPAAYCKDLNKGGKGSTMREISILASVVGGVVVIVAIVFVVGLLVFRRRQCRRESFVLHVAPKVKQDHSPSGISSELFANARLNSEGSNMGNQSSPLYKVFSVGEMEEATKNFDQTTLLGEGSLGKVYKGRLENGTLVAIRSLALSRKYSIQNLKLRLDMLSKLCHPHLVGLLGHCIDGGTQEDSTIHRLLLVHEYVPNGSLRSHLSEASPEKILKWSDRLSILIDVAKAVHFLHTGVIPPCPNNQLKTNNILLDEHGVAKLSDYGMSIFMDETEKTEGKGDMAKSGQVEKLQDDVYDFGFILLESLVGPNLNGKREAFLLNEMTSFSSQDGRRKIVDPIVLTTSSQESLSIVVSITNKCISPEPSSRPSFEGVLWNLQYAAQVQTAADSDQKSETLSPQSFS
ncbi:probable inactive leucine-rich repeat receptor-like protein kinase At3g03770 [Andrographis paniculata]|uniref:probable inactive leucine-rich repeat receptor-like protein kinase At3g03770 n=1 Tax=Andrographis paniculata TaxID=175694 RepID=UPI0021E993FC|nr:probable inactive leucine-rich repeat receptor-like protein kinase At3g03770 [Andrographis paniculata]